MGSIHARSSAVLLALATSLAGCDCGGLKTTCEEPTWPCGSACVNLSNDPHHCGGCGQACAPTQVCYQGLCLGGCPTGTEDCERRCVFLATDEQHCGACGLTCAAQALCCQGDCVDARSDPENCGACERTCAPGMFCREGECSAGCQPDCVDRACGDDGCGGSCGDCAAGEVCVLAEGQCAECTPACAGLACGADPVCGASCGDCQAGEECAPEGQCEPVCAPDCLGQECGLDPVCGALECGACPVGEACDDQGGCLPACSPDCQGRTCGDDGCGGSCGDCDEEASLVCVEASGACAACTPDCAGRECGLDPVCGAACGACEEDESCGAAGLCDGPCQPDCAGAECGPDPICGSLSCGDCGPGLECGGLGRCQPGCAPDCQGRVCGPDPVCGVADCGVCPEGGRCSADGQCLPPCGEACEPFSIVLLPDTQYYTQKQVAGPQNTLFKQLQWVLEHRQDHDIRFVIHLGDITNKNTAEQWDVADAAFDLLDAAGMPYSVIPGNHDYKKGKKWARSYTRLNDYFGPARFAGRTWYAGHLGDGNENNVSLFEAGPYRFMVLGLEYAPTKDALCWAEQQIAAHPDRRVIVVSHCVQTHGGGHADCPSVDYKVPGGSGQTIWDELASRHSNVFLVVSGHVNDSEHKVRMGLGGNPVHEILTDYQMEGAQGQCHAGTYTGNGWMRELVFDPRANRVQVRTFTVEEGNLAVFPGGAPALFCPDYAAQPGAAAHQFDFPHDFSTLALDQRTVGSRASTDFTVHTLSAGDQLRPVLAGRLGGGFAAVWEDDSSDADGAGNHDVMLRIFDPDGCAVSPQLRVNPDGAGHQLAPAVGLAADGRIVVAWQDDTDDNGSYQIHARGFDWFGNPRFSTTVNEQSRGQQTRPAVAVAMDGSFVVAWEDDADGDGDSQVMLRGFDADGSERFDQRSAHADARGDRQRPALAAQPDGGFVVAWEDDSDGNGIFQIHARGFDADGAERLPRLTVNTRAAGQQRSPAVAADLQGNFVVAWEDDQDRDGAYQILARGFLADGRARFSDRRVHSRRGGQHRAPALGVTPGGAFAVAWQDDGDGNGSYQIRAAAFSPVGARGSGYLAEQTINRFAAGQQWAPGLALDGAGGLVVAWQDDMDGNGSYQILARGFDGCFP